MSEIQVKSWNDLHDTLFADSWHPDLRRYRSPYAFRGMPDTSLMRLGGDYAEKEHHLLRNLRKYASRNYVENDTVWDWLALGKHHGLPTRLLDWSFSPLVGLHFTTSDLDLTDQDGVIWEVNYNEIHKYLPDQLRSQLTGEGSAVFTVEMLDHAARSPDDLGRLSPAIFPVFFEPPSMDDRIVNQYALFSMMSSPTVMFDDWLSIRSCITGSLSPPG